MKRHLSALAAACLAVITAQSAQAQMPAPAQGLFRYQSDASYPGGGSTIWDTVREVRDTVVNGRKMLLTAQHALRGREGGFVYNSLAVWDPSDLRRLHQEWDGKGREPGTCSLDIVGDSMRVRINGEPAVASASTGPVVPDFALETYLSVRELRDGDTVRVKVLRCEDKVRYFDFVGAVKSDTLARKVGVAAEPVWVVRGDPSLFGWTYWIAKSDRHVLRTMMDGEYGSQVNNLLTVEAPVKK